MNHYFPIDKPATTEFKDRGSKFIAYAFAIQTTEDFKQRLKELKKEHSKAAHHCFAYRIGTDGNNFRVSDDGEPSGTAGKPVLGQIDSRSLTNIRVIVVRYFGGTLLGVPGLVNAYKTVTTLALQLTPIVQKQVELVYQLEFDYTRMNEVIMIVKNFNCSIVEQQMQLFCTIKIGIPKSRLEELLYSITELQGIKVIRFEDFQ